MTDIEAAMKRTSSWVMISVSPDEISPSGFHIAALCVRCEDIPLDTDCSIEAIFDAIRDHLKTIHGVIS